MLAAVASCVTGVGPVAGVVPTKARRIGVLCDESVSYFFEQLRALGCEQHRNVEVIFQDVDASADPERHAARLAERNVAVIIACSNELAAAAKRATPTIPIVLLYGIAPVEAGLVESLATPGGNVTGSVGIPVEMAAKSVELFKVAIPSLRRIAALQKEGNAVAKLLQMRTQRAAEMLGLSLTTIEVSGAGNLPKDFERLRRDAIDGILVSPSLVAHVPDIVALTAVHRIPAMYPFAPAVRAGGLMGYFPRWESQSRKNAQIVDQILRGARPRNIPMQQPLEYAFGVNLKTARALGITFSAAAMLHVTWTVE